MMNSKSGPRMVLAAISFAVACHATAQQVNSVQRNYADDAIVRDLKAGKLTVREAQILRDRRDHGTVRTRLHKTVIQPVHGSHQAGAGKHIAKKSKAPVKRVTGPHDKRPAIEKASKKKVSKKGGSGTVHAARSHPHRVVAARAEPPRTAKVQSPVAPARKTAVRYIR